MFGRLARMLRSVLILQDTPHSIALGTAIGLFIAWTPTIGIHMILVVAFCLLLRANKTASLVAVYVSNPLTMGPMYWIDYWLGALVLDRRFTYAELQAVLDYHGWDGFKQALWTLCVDLAGPMWLGGLVLAMASAVPGYYITRWAVERYQRRLAAQTSNAATNEKTEVAATASQEQAEVVAASPAAVNNSPSENHSSSS